MGHAAEQLMHEFDHRQDNLVRIARLRRLRSIAPGWWITKKGEPIEIRALAKEHLANIINMLKKIDMHRTRKYKELVAEQARRSNG